MIIEKDEYIKKLEEFMAEIARITKCLPSYADPSPDGDNKHIINSINLLIEQNKKLHLESFDVWRFENTINIVHSDGEGGGFNLEAFEKCVKKFFNANF